MTYRTVTVRARLKPGIVSVTPALSGNISAQAEIINRIAYSNMEEYEGPYEVTPLAYDEQVLATANKQMSQDVTVHKVPFYETSNEHGTTVYIAEE